MCENINCKYCNSNRINKDGFVNKGIQRYLCRDCKRIWTEGKDT